MRDVVRLPRFEGSGPVDEFRVGWYEFHGGQGVPFGWESGSVEAGVAVEDFLVVESVAFDVGDELLAEVVGAHAGEVEDHVAGEEGFEVVVETRVHASQEVAGSVGSGAEPRSASEDVAEAADVVDVGL